jgi:hypothetical protein
MCIEYQVLALEDVEDVILSLIWKLIFSSTT